VTPRGDRKGPTLAVPFTARTAIAVWIGLAASSWHAGLACAAEPPAPGARLTLSEAVALASAEAPAVRIALLKSLEAVARRGQERASLLPSLSGSAFGLNRTFNLEAQGFSLPGFPVLIGPVDQVDARLRVTQALFDAPSWLRLRARGFGVDASHAEADGSAEAAAQQAALAYVRAARAEAVVTAREADLALAQALVELAREQLEAGTGVTLDLTRARTQEAAARGELLVARHQADRAGIDLARALGLDPGLRWVLADTLGATLGKSEAPEQADSASSLGLSRRPELTAERARLERAQAERRAIVAERLPRLDAAADYGSSGAHWPDAIPTRTFLVQASIPLFDGLRREQRTAEQDAVAREAEVRATDLGRQIAAEAQAAVLDLASGKERESVAVERVRLAEEELSEARERFASGVAGSIDVIQAQASVLHARDAVIDARTAVATARVALARAAGVARTLR
jgi:outer membrane protein